MSTEPPVSSTGQHVRRILVLADGPIPSVDIVVNQPFAVMASRGLIEYEIAYQPPPVDITTRFDTVFIMRCCDTASVEFARAQYRRGIRIIYAIDDDFSSLDPSTPLGARYRELRAWEHVIELCKLADDVWVFSGVMGSKLASYTNRISMMPALANVELIDRLRANRKEPARARNNALLRGVRFGYAAGTTHANDLAEIAPAVERAIARFEGRLEFELICVSSPSLEKNPRVKSFPCCSNVEQFLRFLDGREWDFAIAPLGANAFNDAKTDNKYREYSALGIPAIYSASPVYATSVIPGETGLLASSIDEWFAAICRFVDDAPLRRTIAARARSDIARRSSLDAVVDRYGEAFARTHRRKRVLVCGPESNSTVDIDINRPLRALEAAGSIALDVRPQAAIYASDVEGRDAFVVVRYCDLESVALLRRANQCGVPSLFTWDDDFFSFPDGLGPLSAYYRNPSIRANLASLLSEARWLKVSTSRLREVSEKFNGNVFHWNYGFDFSQLQSIVTVPHRDRVIVGFFGSPHRERQFAHLQPVLSDLLRVYPHVELEFLGFFPTYAAALPRTRHIAWQDSPEAAIKTLASRGWDIGLAPLETNEFNRAKAPTKYRDYAACRIAGVYSDLDAYREHVVDGVTGLIVPNQPEAWSAAIRKLIDDPALRSEIADRAYDYVRQKLSLETAVDGWNVLLAKLVSGEGTRAGVVNDEVQPSVRRVRVANRGQDAALVVRVPERNFLGLDLWLNVRDRPECSGQGTVGIDDVVLRSFTWRADASGWLHIRIARIVNAHLRDLTVRLRSSDALFFATLSDQALVRGYCKGAPVHAEAAL